MNTIIPLGTAWRQFLPLPLPAGPFRGAAALCDPHPPAIAHVPVVPACVPPHHPPCCPLSCAPSGCSPKAVRGSSSPGDVVALLPQHRSALQGTGKGLPWLFPHLAAILELISRRCTLQDQLALRGQGRDREAGPTAAARRWAGGAVGRPRPGCQGRAPILPGAGQDQSRHCGLSLPLLPITLPQGRWRPGLGGCRPSWGR